MDLKSGHSLLQQRTIGRISAGFALCHQHVNDTDGTLFGFEWAPKEPLFTLAGVGCGIILIPIASALGHTGIRRASSQTTALKNDILLHKVSRRYFSKIHKDFVVLGAFVE